MVIEVNKINWGKSITVGITAGLVAGLVKLGWENILPPRTPERDQTNPPQNIQISNTTKQTTFEKQHTS